MKLAFGSTGKHYAQIKHGAPFDVFFAADSRRPERLEEEAVAIKGSRFTYAIGKLVLWSPEKDFVDAEGKVLASGNFPHLAVANSRLAPYGYAAKQILTSRSLWDSLKRKMVRGENIGQAFQFVKSGNVKLGFVAYSQLKMPGKKIPGSYWLPDPSLYDPIEQQAVLLKEKSAAREFLDYVAGDQGQAIIRSYGYDTP